jgi:hypothetical protein
MQRDQRDHPLTPFSVEVVILAEKGMDDVTDILETLTVIIGDDYDVRGN